MASRSGAFPEARPRHGISIRCLPGGGATLGDTLTVRKTSASDRRVLIDQARALLVELCETLFPQRHTGTFELTRFFPTGLKSDIRKSIADLQGLLDRGNAASMYEDYATIQGTSELQVQLSGLEAQLGEEVDAATQASSVSKATAGTWQELRDRWNLSDRATQRIVKGLFIRAGLKTEWKALFQGYRSSGSES